MSYRERKAIRKKWHKRSFLLLSFCLLLLLIDTYGVSAVRLSSGVMEPNLSSGDIVIASRFYSRNAGKIAGQIVLLEAGPDKPFITMMLERIISVLTLNKIHLSSLLHSEEQGTVMRRAVAVPGDLFMVKDKVVFFKKNNDILSEMMMYESTYQIEKYIQPALLEEIRLSDFSEDTWQTVPENKVLCLGDFRNRYLDSFEVGFVDIGDIQWIVRLQYWPLNEIKFL